MVKEKKINLDYMSVAKESIKFLIAIFFILSAVCLHAQSKWFAAPLVGISTIEGDNKKVLVGCNTSLTLGRYVSDFGVEGKEGRLRADIAGSYYFFPDNRIFSTAALITAHDRKTSVSMGFGVQKSENREKYDPIIPLNASFTIFRMSDILHLGIDANINANLSDFWGRTPISLGLFLGIGM
ncbi:MAG: hypothetical protein FWH18_11240 [Marinilabiliaceae bacterium]|nr:hypothetical protein [Marinilabiliaceae bacterium]